MTEEDFDKLEPAAVETVEVPGGDTIKGANAELSMAISLKRIADRLDALGTGVDSGLYGQFVDMMWQAGQAFERGKGTA